MLKKRYRMHAEFWRTIAQPKRIEILELLRGGETNVSEIAKAMEVHPVTVSQELAPLRNAGVVQTRRNGKRVYYRLASPKILLACDLLAEAMQEATSARAAVVRGGSQRLARARKRA